jgi:hypothetical protein
MDLKTIKLNYFWRINVVWERKKLAYTGNKTAKMGVLQGPSSRQGPSASFAAKGGRLPGEALRPSQQISQSVAAALVLPFPKKLKLA